jgi:hypothetical protein
MTDKKPSKLFSFRVPADLAEQIDQAVRISGKDKSAWMLTAVQEKLGKPSGTLSPESRMEVLIGEMEVLLGGPGGVPERKAQAGTATSKTTLTAKDVIAEMVGKSKRQGIQSSNKAIASRLNELGIRPARGDQWTTGAVDSIKRRMKNFGVAMAMNVS